MNPIYKEMSAPMQNGAKQMFQAFRKGGNPMGQFLSMAAGNPQMKPIVDMIKNGANPEALARKLLTEKGIDPDEFVKGLMG